ncbi:MAG: hypothetical protein WDZ59_01520 [Pirellulales bacterium]
MASPSASGEAEESEQVNPHPSFATAAASVRRDFLALSYYKPGDIISESQVSEALDHLKLLGWTVPDAAPLLARVLDDREYLVRQLRTERGTKFMRKISGQPSSYDRLQRLTELPRGRRMIYGLIHSTGGEEMITDLVSTDGGKNLGRMLSQAPQTGHLNKPIGNIYTVDQLIERLEASYHKTLEQQEKVQEDESADQEPEGDRPADEVSEE